MAEQDFTSQKTPQNHDRLKIYLIITVILVSGLLLGFISLLSVGKAYIWVVFLLVATITGGVIATFRMVKKKTALIQLKSNFVSSISHELKTPLTSINMFVEMLLLKLYEDEADTEEYLHVIQKECNRLIRLVDRVLDFSKIENKKMGFHYQQESINEVILYAVRIFQTQLAESDCNITMNLADNLPQLQIDKDTISEALLNLLNNAVKYSLEDKRVTINTQIVNNHVAIEVIDNGIGISEHHQKKIFEPFYRVNDPLSKDAEGTGLGLAYVKHIAEAHGGKVTVQSKAGHGSKFTLFLPYSKKGREIATNSDSRG